LTANNFYYPDQCHTAVIKEVSSATTPDDLLSTDALITSEPGCVICVTTADCVPIILYDPLKNLSSVIHAGWRGLVAGIIPSTLTEMRNKFRCNPGILLHALVHLSLSGITRWK